MRSIRLLLAFSLLAVKVIAGSAYVGCYSTKGQSGFKGLTDKYSQSNEGDCIVCTILLSLCLSLQDMSSGTGQAD